MKVTILYFASLREALGLEREEVELPAEVATAGALQGWLVTRGGEWSARLAEGRAVRVAVNKKMADRNTVLTAGAEIAFFPPVTGG